LHAYLQFKHEDFDLRTPDLHHYHCSLLTGALRDCYSTTYGVNFKSCLNDINHFNVANWQLPQDFMLEEVVKVELQLILQVYIFEKKLFTLSFLNSRLESFSYGYSESECKPSLLYATSESSSISFHRSGRSLKNTMLMLTDMRYLQTRCKGPLCKLAHRAAVEMFPNGHHFLVSNHQL